MKNNISVLITLWLAKKFRLAVTSFLLSITVPTVAQGPNTDFAAWPSGLLTLITASYYGAAVDGEQLESIDPASSFRELGLLDYFRGYARGHDEDLLRYVDLALVLTGIKSGTLLRATVIRCRRN